MSSFLSFINPIVSLLTSVTLNTRQEAVMSHQIFNNRDTLEVILSFLSPADIKTAALVSNFWREVVEQPRYWTWAKARLSDLNFKEMFYSQRFRNIGHVELFLVDPNMKEDFFRYLREQNCRLRSLEVRRRDLSSLYPYFEADIKLEELAAQIFSQIADSASDNSNLSLSKLDISYTWLNALSPELLSNAVLRLEEVNLTSTNLTTDQVKTLFTAIVERDNFKLRNLNISSNPLLFVPEDTLSRACLKLTKLNILGCRLVDGHYNSLFQAIRDSQELKLKTLIVPPRARFAFRKSELGKACLNKVNILFSNN